MTKRIRYNKKLLEYICERDNCVIDFDIIEEYSRDIDIKFICNCGELNNKTIGTMYKKGGGYCKKCTTYNMVQKVKTTCINKYGVEHPSKLQEFKDKQQQTCLERYGVTNASKTKEIQDKMKQTCLKKYGVEYTTQLQETKNKSKQTCLEIYGVEYSLQSEEVREKSKQTCLEKYGVISASQSEKIKDKIKQTLLKNHGVEYAQQSSIIREKSKQSCLEKFGVENAFQSEEKKEKMKQTSLERYGVEYPNQNPEIYEKNSKNFKLKEFKFPCGNIIYVQGYEPFLLNILVNEGYTFDDIITSRLQVPKIWYFHNDKKHRYYCDVYIPKTNTIYEVKSKWTYQYDTNKNQLKKQACIDNGYNFQLYVFDGKGNIIEKMNKL